MRYGTDVMGDDVKTDALSAKGRVEVGPTKSTLSGEVRVPELLAALLLDPERRAEAKVLKRVAKGQPLTEDQQKLIEPLHARRKLENLHCFAELLREALPEEMRRMRLLSPSEPREREPDLGFVDRLLSDVEDVSDAKVADLYARILAGEIARPGSYSRAALRVLRYLDQDVAVTFSRNADLLTAG